MIDFACRQFDLDEIVKCGLGLTKAEYKVMNHFLKNPEQDMTTTEISRKIQLDLTTVQKAVKKLADKRIILRHQRNLDNGGYVFIYACNSKPTIRAILKKIIREWADNVSQEIDIW